MKHAVLRLALAVLFAVSTGAATAQTPDTPASQKSTPVQLVDALNGVFGKHPGARAVHAKGVVLEGTFVPSASALTVSKAPHFQTPVPVIVRFSNFAGIPDIADTHPLASPRGMAIKFKLPDGSDTDIVSHSFNGFPSATADDFRDLLIALGTSGPDASKPTPLDAYLGSHPVAKAFLTAPKPFPVSYASLPYFGVNTFRFLDANGVVTYGRYQILPVGGEHYLPDAKASKAAPDYLQSEIRQRVGHAPARFRLVLQIAESGDKLDDPSVAWSSAHRTVELGTISITKAVADNDAAQRRLLFLPNALPAGIEVADPMINARSAAYPVSFARRQQ
ncbi:catalase family peroxidase [Paraburkholderia sabiae]|uniref:Catalase-related peroxidase n=1 Tax=Paraburkholderia sabiae TaxID=273251 RepID=A0ABU9QKE0_9BURK|nr:catalase family peroxidase [Paraburkholderia sabiae]WJZ76440.1 catalase family peroxidase [Paraburkholderia sabiae]CAD6560052.1 Catalase-related peroxidase [Paraburkholderia sabiae]